MKKILLLLIGVFFVKGLCFGSALFETEDFTLSMDAYLRNDLVTFKNVVDLDSANSDDTTTYLGIDYSLGFNLKSKGRGPSFYLKLERNGPGDYSAPLFVHNTLMNSGGRIQRYRDDELLPQLEEFWWDTPLADNFGFKAGLYTYEVGYGFSLNGSFENYGFTFYRKLKNSSWRLYYCRPDLVYKNRLGPRIRYDQEQGYEYNHNSSNFFAADVKFEKDDNFLQPYIGVLADYTSPDKRDNVFTAPVKKDILGTVGFAWKRKGGNLTFDFEAARNFGKAESADARYEDVYHAGYLVYSNLDYKMGKITPSASLLLASGNKVTPEMAENQSETLVGGKNRAFSSYSPLNKNLGDSISACNSEARPIVAMGSGCGLHYGIPSPRTLASSDFDNLFIPSLGFDFNVTEKLCAGVYGYYLRAFEKGVGTLNNQGKFLSRDLGSEVDLFIDYQLNPHALISILGGYFFPGRYYKEERDDTAGSLFSPFVRQDGETDSAYQIELAVELKF